ncbi:hypothetical protein L226DRAFT_525245 [Lentinus tigrinus ALCF2SS1-7]|uniref:uncharacterized protein n=1 Tax=Lentinus tigrinus ALCF2SS1-7 TaxID=1328758 RepID=UPI001165F62B|nr:hypothetical protein L226DRAFT_525245 [Lentinus tigrinus ALCF2SS1-7]
MAIEDRSTITINGSTVPEPKETCVLTIPSAGWIDAPRSLTACRPYFRSKVTVLRSKVPVFPRLPYITDIVNWVRTQDHLTELRTLYLGHKPYEILPADLKSLPHTQNPGTGTGAFPASAQSHTLPHRDVNKTSFVHLPAAFKASPIQFHGLSGSARIACSPASRSWACGGLSLGLKLVHTARSTQHRGYLPSTLTVRSSGTGETAVARMTVTSLRDSLMRQQVIGCLSGARACQSLHTSQRQMTASPIERLSGTTPERHRTAIRPSECLPVAELLLLCECVFAQDSELWGESEVRLFDGHRSPLDVDAVRVATLLTLWRILSGTVQRALPARKEGGQALPLPPPPPSQAHIHAAARGPAFAVSYIRPTESLSTPPYFVHTGQHMENALIPASGLHTTVAGNAYTPRPGTHRHSASPTFKCLPGYKADRSPPRADRIRDTAPRELLASENARDGRCTTPQDLVPTPGGRRHPEDLRAGGAALCTYDLGPACPSAWSVPRPRGRHASCINHWHSGGILMYLVGGNLEVRASSFERRDPNSDSGSDFERRRCDAGGRPEQRATSNAMTALGAFCARSGWPHGTCPSTSDISKARRPHAITNPRQRVGHMSTCGRVIPQDVEGRGRDGRWRFFD